MPEDTSANTSISASCANKDKDSDEDEKENEKMGIETPTKKIEKKSGTPVKNMADGISEVPKKLSSPIVVRQKGLTRTMSVVEFLESPQVGEKPVLTASVDSDSADEVRPKILKFSDDDHHTVEKPDRSPRKSLESPRTPRSPVSPERKNSEISSPSPKILKNTDLYNSDTSEEEFRLDNEEAEAKKEREKERENEREKRKGAKERKVKREKSRGKDKEKEKGREEKTAKGEREKRRGGGKGKDQEEVTGERGEGRSERTKPVEIKSARGSGGSDRNFSTSPVEIKSARGSGGSDRNFSTSPVERGWSGGGGGSGVGSGGSSWRGGGSGRDDLANSEGSDEEDAWRERESLGRNFFGGKNDRTGGSAGISATLSTSPPGERGGWGGRGEGGRNLSTSPKSSFWIETATPKGRKGKGSEGVKEGGEGGRGEDLMGDSDDESDEEKPKKVSDFFTAFFFVTQFYFFFSCAFSYFFFRKVEASLSNTSPCAPTNLKNENEHSVTNPNPHEQKEMPYTQIQQKTPKKKHKHSAEKKSEDKPRLLLYFIIIIERKVFFFNSYTVTLVIYKILEKTEPLLILCHSEFALQKQCQILLHHCKNKQGFWFLSAPLSTIIVDTMKTPRSTTKK